MRKKSSKRSAGQRKKRDVVRRTPQRTTGGKVLIEGSAEWQSRLESLAIDQLSMAYDVTKLISQETRGWVDFLGKSREYTPDLCPTVAERQRMVEVKPLELLLDPETREHYAELSTCLHRDGYQLDFVTDDQLLVMPRRHIATTLSRYVRHETQANVTERILDAVQSRPCSIGSILTTRTVGASLADIYALVATKRLSIDWEQPLGAAARLKIPTLEDGGVTYEDILHSGQYGLFLERLVLEGGADAERVLAAAKARRRRIPNLAEIGFV